MNLKNVFIIIFAGLGSSLYSNDDDRAPRLDAPPVTSPISVVVPSLDLGAVFQTLARINCKIGNVNQDVCADTVLSVLGDACDILGISISEALSILLDCCQTNTLEISEVFTTMTTDFQNTWTILADLKDTLTNCGMPIAITQEMIPFTVTEPGLYCLAENVTVPDGATGITVIDAEAVIDLNGHRMLGGAVGISMGSSVTNDPFAVVIKNGIISGQTTAGITSSAGSIFPECIITEIIFENIRGGTAGINDQGTILSVYNCEFNGSFLGGGDGIVSTATMGLIKNCHFSFCNGGMRFSGANSLIVEDCVIQSSSDVGINLSGQQSIIRNVKVIQALTSGGIVISGTDMVIENCQLIGNLGFGILISSGARINILGCSVINTFLSGVGIQINATEVIVSGCSLNRNDSIGIALGGTSTNCEVINNIIIGAGGTVGISNTGVLNRIYRNYATNNLPNYSGVTPVNSPGGALTGTFSDFIANVSN